ncbi:hypothetical protein SAMN02745824_0131 [Parasphingorhabdus marina DSM 22363]|uniref:DUF1285 domain-containing protein n=1 Tax=Parasphingorhabdus marina DSM 22363 TaxID=1123272 RepID=A0A1N6CM00_9SPHN|nr:DUF1285 domain-containing protein [Parasphingorhabdus marina]SIN59603.1 hypothetical protein SAMN02745824_0131 [Parasphingorhabdus marina DSM 22363]
MPYAPPPEMASLSLSDIADLVAQQKLPPVEQWDPQETGDSEMRIASDGGWFHQGDPISRPAMVRAFSTLLRREEDGSFALVTPYQKLAIAVDDVPFVAVEMESSGTGADRKLAFRLNTDHLVLADQEHPLRFPTGTDAPQPYLTVRRGLEAVLARPVYYTLAEMALEDNLEPFGIWSHGTFFAIDAGP